VPDRGSRDGDAATGDRFRDGELLKSIFLRRRCSHAAVLRAEAQAASSHRREVLTHKLPDAWRL
jgi:hypothetical protein